MSENFEELQLAAWTVRVRDAVGERPPEAALLLHGLTGDEQVMEIFSTKLPGHFQQLAPRAIFPADGSGYSWVKEDQGPEPEAKAFKPAISAVLDLLDTARFDLAADFARAHLLGFSQGAALAYLIALRHPERVASLAGLSGFLPPGTDPLIETAPLSDVPVFVSHGTQDTTVSIERGRFSVRQLQRAGGRVTYCEAEVGHKLSADCFRALAHFYESLESSTP